MMKQSVAVVGGGAAGLMAAVTAARAGKSVLLIEKMPRPARKLMITGKGRCNLTNHTDRNGLIANVCHNGRFLYSAFSAFSAEDVMRFFEEAGVPLKTERGNRVFPVSDRSVDIVDALVRSAKQAGVRFQPGEVSEIVTDEAGVTAVRCRDGSVYPCDAAILATGGLSYPATGSTGDGFHFARSLGHTVTELRPSLVPFEIHEGFCSFLSGLSLKNVSFRVATGGKTVFEEQGELLFTHFGLSGPLVLSASAAIDVFPAAGVCAFIDLKPALTSEQLDRRILRDFEQAGGRELLHAMEKLMPKKLISMVLSLAGIDPHTRVSGVTRNQREALVRVIKALPLTVTGLRPFEEAIITRGGVSVREIDPRTMASKLIKGLYFAGEIIDVDAFTGGFNLQIAFSTGYLAGKNV